MLDDFGHGVGRKSCIFYGLDLLLYLVDAVVHILYIVWIVEDCSLLGDIEK